MRPSLGDIRKKIHNLLIKQWIERAKGGTRRSRVAGLDLAVFPTVFHPKYFGSSSILGSYLETLDLGGKTLLDMGTGSGVIGLRAARAGARVTAVDINPAAVACARANAASNDLTLEVVEGDLFDALNERRFDFVVWNPPFFPRPARDAGEEAFFAGKDFTTIEAFARNLRRHLNSGGKSYLILSFDVDVARLTQILEAEGFDLSRVATRRWGLGEKMVVLEAR